MRLFTSKSPRIVGRDALFEDVLDDFLHTLPRLKPWRLARYEALLDDFSRHLDGAMGRPAPLRAFAAEHVKTWRRTLAEPDRPFADEALRDLEAFLVAWGWTDAPRDPRTAWPAAPVTTGV